MFKSHKIAVKPPMLDVTVQMSSTMGDPFPMRSVFTNVLKVTRHTHELEIVQPNDSHTFINSCDYTTYWYTRS